MTETTSPELQELEAELASLYDRCDRLVDPADLPQEDRAAIQFMLQNRTRTELVAIAPSPRCVVQRNFDMWMGIYLDPAYPTPVSVTVHVGHYVATNALPLRPGKVCFAVEGLYALPLLSLRYAEVRMYLSDPLALEHCTLIGAMMDVDLRTTMAHVTWTGVVPGAPKAEWALGKGSMGSSEDSYYSVANRRALPRAKHPPDEKRVWQAKIAAELAAAKWHLARMEHWMAFACTDEEP